MLEHGATHSGPCVASLVRCAEGTRPTERRRTLSKKKQRPCCRPAARVLYAHTLTHNMGALAEAGEALDICDLEVGLLLNLYKIAQYELAVDKWDNRAEV